MFRNYGACLELLKVEKGNILYNNKVLSKLLKDVNCLIELTTNMLNQNRETNLFQGSFIYPLS
jgi:hypothetical protein